MSDANEFLRIIKQAALDAVSADKPVNICFGTVTNASPLQINVDQKMTLGEKQLILCRNVTDFKTKVKAGNIQSYYYTDSEETVTETVGHTHAVGEIEVTIENGLAVGDQVILIRQQGGQKFIVWDRVAT